MLTASTINGSLLNLADRCFSLDELRQLRRSTHYYCPGCRERVVMKLGEKKIWHFAHQGSPPCEMEWERESNYHLTGKQQLYDWLREDRQDVQLEHVLIASNQRPDLFLPSSRTAIEFQCASIEASLLTKRSFDYNASNIHVTWILGAKRLKRLYSLIHTLSAMDWAAASNHRGSPAIYYYCPEERTFANLTIHYSLTPTKFICTTTYLSASTTSYFDLFKSHTPFTNHESMPIWFKQKQIWRQNPHGEKSFIYYFLRKRLYLSGKSIRFFPSEAGIPSSQNYWIETPSYLWQMWIIICFLSLIPQNKTFSMQSLINAFQQVIDATLIKVRNGPHNIQGEGVSAALKGYIDQLVRLKVLKEWDNERYEKLYQPEVHQQVEQCTKNDHEILGKLV